MFLWNANVWRSKEARRDSHGRRVHASDTEKRPRIVADGSGSVFERVATVDGGREERRDEKDDAQDEQQTAGCVAKTKLQRVRVGNTLPQASRQRLVAKKLNKQKYEYLKVQN